MATPQPANSSSTNPTNGVIDTGRTLGKDVKIQNGKIQLPSADIQTSPRPLAPEVLGTQPQQTTAAGTAVTTEKIHMLEPHTYYSSPNNEVRLYSDAAGQVWLTVSPVVAGLMFVSIVGLAILPLLVSLTRQKMRLKAKRRAERRAMLAETTTTEVSQTEEVEVLPDSSETQPQKFRKISL